MCRTLRIVAHGENWEVAAMHVVSDLIRKMNQEQIHKRESTTQDGSLGVYTKNTTSLKNAIVIPLSNLTHPSNDHSEIGSKQDQ